VDISKLGIYVLRSIRGVVFYFMNVYASEVQTLTSPHTYAC